MIKPMKFRSLFFVFLFLNGVLFAQQPIKSNTTEIYESIQKLNFLGSVLYLAAHPDDENTRLISYFSNQVKARTAYLSITRGDGGQNLIGSELKELLGVIRTQELLAARRIDGGEQFFTRAKDFGYSKHPDETLEIWNKDEVLKDVVSIIRKFKPDVIINRFNTESAGKTHGHHTSSALLSSEAFDLVGDTTFKSHNLYKPWQPKRLFFNTSSWFYSSKEKFDRADKSKMLSFDTGVFYPLSGLSNTEIAALSRSQHQSQGFGNTGTRGEQKEYIELVKGEFPSNGNVFEGIDTTWSRVVGGAEIGQLLKKVESNFDFKNPSASIPNLLKASQLISDLKDEHWKAIKSKEIKEIILACSGLYLEAVSSQPSAYPSEEVSFSIDAINRSTQNVKLKNVQILPLDISDNSTVVLQNNKNQSLTLKGVIPVDIHSTNSYWLNQQSTLGMYSVADTNLIGDPETPKNIKVNFSLDINGYITDYQKDVIFKYNDPVKGEVYQSFEILPKVTASIANKVTIFETGNAKEIPITIRSSKDNIKGSIILCTPNDWEVSPEKVEFSIAKKGEEKTVVFMLSPPDNQSEGFISPIVKVDGVDYSQELIEIDYNHIPKQTILMASEAKVVRLDIKKKGNLIGYIQGAGDQVPASLRHIGYTVVELNEKDIKATNLKKFDAVVLGIRTYNVDNKATFYQKELHKYTENGGTLIVQYNTSRGLKVDEVAPFSLRLSRDRVVEEDAKVKFLAKDHELLNLPNIINESDFNGWIQERGLYFPDKWAKEFTPLLSMHDKGESAKKGSLLVAKYGKGYFIYTGLSFFRELPAGVPGAYKLFANMLSIGKNKSK